MRILFLIIFFVMSFRNFQYFPGMAPIQETWFVLCFIFFITLYPWLKARKQWRFSSFELYLLTMILFIPLMASGSAWREFGQPIIYGVLSQRSVTLFAGALLLIHGLRNQMFTLRDVEKSLLFLAWGTLILYLIMKTFLDPSMFTSYGKGFVEGGDGEHPFFKLPGFFIVFGIFYYAFLGFRKKNWKYYLVAIGFFLFLLGDAGARAMTVTMLIAFLFFVYRWGGRARMIKTLLKMLVISALILGAANFLNPEAVSGRIAKISDAFTVVFTGNDEVEDVSAGARILETLIAMPYIQKNPLLGNGNISYQWQGGYEGVLGGYFYPSDIGIIGVLYMYGVVGFLIFAWQYWFAIREANRLPIQMHSPLLDATKGVLLYMALHSLTAGFFVHFAEVSFLFIALLMCIVREMRASDQPIKTVSK